MTDFVEVYNQTTGRLEQIPEDWLDSPILDHDLAGKPFIRMDRPFTPEPRPTATDTHEDIDAFAREKLGEDYVFPEDVKNRKQKVELLDQLVPAVTLPEQPAPPADTPVAPVNPEVQLTGPVSDESPYGAVQADEQEN